jgi:hypothetical protein
MVMTTSGGRPLARGLRGPDPPRPQGRGTGLDAGDSGILAHVGLSALPLKFCDSQANSSSISMSEPVFLK